MSDGSHIIYQEVPRDFRTEIPNIVFELLESGEISPTDFILYSTYRRIAGEHGACWVGTRGLEKKTGLSHPTIKKSKKNLSRKFELLGGKSLIEITPCDRKKEQADTVTIIDIWPENYRFFKKRLTCENLGHTGVKKYGTRVCKNMAQKKEPLKKEPYKNPPLSSPQENKKEEEEIKTYKILEDTILSLNQKRRLSTEYTEEQVNHAIQIAKKHKIKKSLMGMIISIIEHPEKWEEEENNSPKEKALKYNIDLHKLHPKLAKKNEESIQKGILFILSKTGMEQISLNSSYFDSDMKIAIKFLENHQTQSRI